MDRTKPQPQRTKQRGRRWSPGETAALVVAWAPLYNRRRGGECDVWVPPHQRSRALSYRELAMEDWRAVATAVNGYIAEAGLPIRTARQCKRRVLLLQAKYGDELATRSWVRFLPDLRLNNAVAYEALGRSAGVAPDGRRAATASGDGDASPAVGVHAAGANARRSTQAAQHPRASMAVDEGAALFGSAIPRRPRTGGSSTSTGAARAPGVEEELVRPANARRGAVDEGRSGEDAGGALAGVAAGSTDASVAAVLAGMRSTAGVAAGVSAATAAQSGSATRYDPSGTSAARNVFGGAIPKRPRTGCSTSAGAARAPSVKEELVRLATACRGAVDEGRSGEGAGSALGGVAADGTLAALLVGRSHNAAVMMALGGFYVELEKIDLEKQKLKVAAVEAARDGGSAGGLP